MNGTAIRHGKWTIEPNYSFAPSFEAWVGVHDDYDGAEDANDNRCITGASVDEVVEAIKQRNLDAGVGCADCGDDWSPLYPHASGRYECCQPCIQNQYEAQFAHGE